MKPKTIVSIPQSRRRILSIQTVTSGGQGVFEAWMLRELSKKSYHSVFSSRIWIQKYDDKEQSEYARLLDGEDIRMVAPKKRDLDTVDPDFIFFHWCSHWRTFANGEASREVIDYLEDSNAPLLVYVHNIDPEALASEERLLARADMLLFPSEHARERAGIDSIPSVVVEHFLDPELSISVVKKQSNKMRIGILGKIQWSKCDPLFHQAIAEAIKGRGEILWIGQNTDQNLQNDYWAMKSLQNPSFKSLWGPERELAFQSMTVGVVLSSVEESFCLGALEMASRGIPIVTNRPEIKKMLGSSAILAIDPYSVVAAIEYLSRNGVAYAKMSKAFDEEKRKFYSVDAWELRLSNAMAIARSKVEEDWTVVITCCNVEHWVRDSIQSALNNNPKEIIIVLDGSKDKTKEVVLQVTEENEQDVTSKTKITILDECGENPHSQAWSWNRAFQHPITTPYVCLLDGDDMLEKHALERIGIAHRSNPKAVMVWGRHRAIDAEGKSVDVCFSNPPSKDRTILEDMQLGKEVVSHPITIKSWLLNFIHIPEKYEASADKYLALVLEEKGPCVFLDEQLYCYRWKRPGSTTDLKNDVQERCREEIIQEATKRRGLK